MKPSVRRAAALAIAGVLLWLLPACGTPPASTVTVQGRLTMGPDLPVAGVLVHAQGQLVTSDGEGRFVLDGLTTPYTVTVASTASPPWADVFVGLTTLTPELSLAVPTSPWALPGAVRSARITGSTPNANPLPPGQRLEVCVAGVDAIVIGCDTVEAGGGASYDLDARWWALGEVDVRLHALLLQVDPQDRPIGILGYGTLPLSLTPNATVHQIAPSGPPPAGIAVQGTLALAGGGSVLGVVAAVRTDDGAAVRVYNGVPPGPTLGFVVPDLAPSRMQVAIAGAFVGGSGYAWSLVDPSAPFTVVLPAPPPQLAPLDGATGVTAATPFTAVGDTNAVHQFAWHRTDVLDGLRVRLLIRGTSVTLPDLTQVGLDLVAGATYRWRVSAWSATSVEEAASLPLQGAGVELFFGYGIGLEGEGWITGSDERVVTLAP